MTGARGIYSIGAVARMVGVSQATIRSWEDRYGVVVPERSEGGRRIYTRDQLEQLQFLKERIEDGLSAADAHRLLAERQAGRGASGERTAPGSSTRLLVLLAESDPYAAQLSEFFLRTEGYDVEIAWTADDAEDRFVAQAPALAIVELMISGGVGRQLCERLKGMRPTPVLTISSLDLREEALAAGADAFLQKPLDPLHVVSTVKDLLGHSALTRDQAVASG